MTVSLRVKGWITPGAVVPVSPETFAEVVHECRRVVELNERLTPESEALHALIRADKDHGMHSEQFADAFRAAVAVAK